jgi:long-subunit acyl-CoA synthetase (AMP-forming)
VFREYLYRPDSTRDSFDAHGYFKTGDIAQRDAAGVYRLLGRNSVDIIKVHDSFFMIHDEYILLLT